jgi:hypothetical protein
MMFVLRHCTASIGLTRSPYERDSTIANSNWQQDDCRRDSIVGDRPGATKALGMRLVYPHRPIDHCAANEPPPVFPPAAKAVQERRHGVHLQRSDQ